MIPTDSCSFKSFRLPDECYERLLSLVKGSSVSIFVNDGYDLDLDSRTKDDYVLIQVSLDTAGNRHDFALQTISSIGLHIQDGCIKDQCDELIKASRQKLYQVEHGFFQILDKIAKRENRVIFFFVDCDGFASFDSSEISILRKLPTFPTLKNVHFVTSVFSHDTDMVKKNSCLSVQKMRIISMEEIKKVEGKPHFSHKWNEVSGSTAHTLYDILKANGIACSADFDDCTYEVDLREYEQRVGSAPVVIAAVDDDYMKSAFCMMELALVFKKGNVENRLCFVRLTDIKKFSPDEQKKNEDYWKGRLNELDKKIKDCSTNKCYVNERMYIETILKYLGEIWEFVNNKMVPGADELSKDGWGALVKDVKKKMGLDFDSKSLAKSANMDGQAIYNSNGGKINVFNGSTTFNGPVNF